MKKCVFAGSFDPFTMGHYDVVRRSLKLFDEVVIAVMVNQQKRTMFTEEERLRMVKAVFEGEKGVRVISFNGLVVDLLKQENTNIYVRGVRNAFDCEYETEICRMNEHLLPDIITVYLPAPNELLYLSSTYVRNLILFGKPTDGCVPAKMQPLLNAAVSARTTKDQ